VPSGGFSKSGEQVDSTYPIPASRDLSLENDLHTVQTSYIIPVEDGTHYEGED